MTNILLTATYPSKAKLERLGRVAAWIRTARLDAEVNHLHDHKGALSVNCSGFLSPSDACEIVLAWRAENESEVDIFVGYSPLLTHNGCASWPGMMAAA